MRFLQLLIVAAALLAPVAASAQRSPVVVELFTSQGCSSCPPADAVLVELAQTPGVIALALHVTLWDYMGWEDVFAQPAFTSRQEDYARAIGKRSVYTPQMVVQGADRVIGSKREQVLAAIAAHQARPAPADLSLVREGGVLRIRIAPTGVAGAGPSEIHLVRFDQGEAVTIEAGENAGLTIPYVNIVTDWRSLGVWDGLAAAEFSVDLAEAGPVAVIVQRTDHGPVLSAAKLP